MPTSSGPRPGLALACGAGCPPGIGPKGGGCRRGSPSPPAMTKSSPARTWTAWCCAFRAASTPNTASGRRAPESMWSPRNPSTSFPTRGRALADECAKAGVVCAVISQNRFADGFAALKAALDRGGLGPTRSRSRVGQVVPPRPVLHGQRLARHDRRRGRRRADEPSHPQHGPDDLAVRASRRRPPAWWVATAKSSRPRTWGVGDDALGQRPARHPSRHPQALSPVSTSASRSTRRSPRASWRRDRSSSGNTRRIFRSPNRRRSRRPTEGLDAKYLLFQRQWRNVVAAIRGEAPLAVTTDEAVAVVETTRKLY